MSNSPLPTTDPTVLTGARTPHPGKGRWRSALGASVTGTVGGVVFLLMCVASLILPWFIAVPAANSALIYARRRRNTSWAPTPTGATSSR